MAFSRWWRLRGLRGLIAVRRQPPRSGIRITSTSPGRRCHPLRKIRWTSLQSLPNFDRLLIIHHFMKMRYTIITCVISIVVLVHSGSAIDGEGTLISQGVERSFLFHAPGDSIAQGLPLVLVFHGLGGNGAFIKQTSGFDAVADANGFIAVYPNSTIIGGVPQWNAYVDEVSGHGGVNDPDATDDVIFVDDLIAWFCTNHGIDPQRIYATGHSYGAYMSYRLAVQRPNIFAAVAPVAGGLWGDPDHLTQYFLQDFQPIPIMQIHGDADDVVPYPDPTNDPEAQIVPLSFFASATCGSTAYTSSPITTNVHRLVFCDGIAPPGARVELIRLEGEGHEWPDVAGFDAAAAIWEFFYEYSLPAAPFTCEMTGIASLEQLNEFSVFPNPATGLIHFNVDLDPGANIVVRDVHGRIVRSEEALTHYLDSSDLGSGIYFLEITGRNGERWMAQFIRE